MDAVLRDFHAGAVHQKFDSRGFFERMITFTLESFLGDSKYGGNKDGVGWRFINWHACWWSPGKIRSGALRDERLPY